MRRLSLSLAALPFLALGACVPAARRMPPPPPAPAPVPVPAPAPAPAPALPADWRDWPLTPGDWSWQADARGSIARFGARGVAPLVMLRCDRPARRIEIARAGAVPLQVTIRTSSMARTLAMAPVANAPGMVAASVAASDPLLDAMGFSRGRFLLETPGAPPLVVPAYAEVLRVTEDCRG